MLDLLSSLIEAPTTLGNEEPGQAIMEEAFRYSLDLEPFDVVMGSNALRAHPHAAPFDWDVEGKRNVCAAWRSREAVIAGSRSLILNGHIDVVGPASEKLWRTPPFKPTRDGDWLYGRGAGDMKAGLATIVGAVLGLRALGLEPCAPVLLQSVVEEECGGNGTLQCLMSGCTAEAAVIPEPYAAFIPTSQVGVLWFHVDIAGAPAHVAEAQEGVNAIEAGHAIVRELHVLEDELNADPPAPFDAIPHPIGLGFEVDGILGRSDLYPREGKNQHAFCVDVDRRGDVRILANTVQTHDAADTMLHELGHGVYDLGFRDDLPWLLRSTHLVATEASALLCGALSGRREWLELILGLSAGDVAELEGRLDAARAAELLVFTRWVLVMNAFERALYADPDGDLDAIWWELVARYQGMTPPADRRAPDWASKIHIAVAPVYYHTYLYGAIVGLQIIAALESAAGGVVDRPAAGAILREKLFAPGESVRWDKLVAQASGAPLSVASLERAVAAA